MVFQSIRENFWRVLVLFLPDWQARGRDLRIESQKRADRAR